MKKFKLIAAAVAMIFTCTNMTNAANSGDIKDLLGKLGGGSGSSTTETLGNLLEGVFSSSNITVQDMQGNWTANGPAVAFQGDNFLKQAGGKAAGAALETKLKPYYTKYGLTGAVLTIDEAGNFQLKIKKLTLKGTVQETAEKGVFEFHFAVAGKINLGKVKTYVQKTSSTMDVMFDASKLITIIDAVAKYSNISVAKTLSSLLSSYDGLCVGFAFNRN